MTLNLTGEFEELGLARKTSMSEQSVEKWTSDDRAPIWAEVQGLASVVDDAIKQGPVPKWVIALHNALNLAQIDMDDEFHKEEDAKFSD